MSSYNIYGGTPKKTLDLMRFFREKSVLYVYHNSYPELKEIFEKTGGEIYEGFYGRNLFLHVKKLLEIIDKENISIVQTQFTMGETLGFFIKTLRPNVKLINAFVGPFKPNKIKSLLVGLYYKKVDMFVYISKYVQSEKVKQFKVLQSKPSKIIFNGTKKRIDDGSNIPKLKKFSILDVARLTEWKNISLLIEAINIIVNEKNVIDINLYVAGDGPQKKELENLVSSYNLNSHVFLLGQQSNIGKLLDNCDAFVHPAYAEGFGIVIPEAMFAEKPIIVSNAGALPELIEHEKTGLVVNPHSPQDWADAILRLMNNRSFSNLIAANALKKARLDFSFDKYVENYDCLYKEIMVS